MKKILLSAAFVVAALTGANAQSVTYTNEEVSLAGLNGLNIFPNGSITGTLTAIEISATKVSGTLDAGELAIYITPTSAFGTGGLMYAGGTTNSFVAADEWQTWPNNDGTDISGTITLNTPISFPEGTTNFVRLANLLSPATAGVWSNVTVTLYGVEEANFGYCNIFVGGPYTDFNTEFGGAPTTEGVTNEITNFEVWKSEAYLMDGIVAGTEYTFSICNGLGAGSWIPDFTIKTPSGGVDAYGVDTDGGCSITWVATESGTYTIGINEEGNCGVVAEIDNGFPAITNNGVASVDNHLVSTFSIYPNPVKDVINITNSVDTIENVTITDMNGRVVKNVTLGANEGQINISDLSQGVYILNAASNGKSFTQKIVKQ